MFDFGDFANGNVRIARDLRRRRNGNGNRNSNARRRRIARNIDVDGNLGDLGTVDIFRDAGNIGIDGNVRLRVEQHYRIVEPHIIGTCHDDQQRSRRNMLKTSHPLPRFVGVSTAYRSLLSSRRLARRFSAFSW